MRQRYSKKPRPEYRLVAAAAVIKIRNATNLPANDDDSVDMPEEAFLFAIIELAIKDYCAILSDKHMSREIHPDGASRANQRSAAKFFKSQAFESWCLLLDLNPEWVRDVLCKLTGSPELVAA